MYERMKIILYSTNLPLCLVVRISDQYSISWEQDLYGYLTDLL